MLFLDIHNLEAFRRAFGPFLYAVHSNAKCSVSATCRTSDRATNRDKQRVTEAYHVEKSEIIYDPQPHNVGTTWMGAVTGGRETLQEPSRVVDPILQRNFAVHTFEQARLHVLQLGCLPMSYFGSFYPPIQYQTMCQ